MKKNLQQHTLIKELMKVTLSQLLMLFFLTGVSFAASNAQEILDRQLTLAIKDQSLKEILITIESKVEVKFAYSREAVSAMDRISISANNEKLGEVLDKLSKLGQIDYQVIGKQIILNQNFAFNKEDALLKFQVVEDIISGKVTTAEGEPIPGVNVLLKGTTVGIVTDADGNYSLRVPDLAGTLIFSYIGYTSIEVPVNGRTTVDVTLTEDITSLDEIVVVGYSSQKKGDITGSSLLWI